MCLIMHLEEITERKRVTDVVGRVKALIVV